MKGNDVVFLLKFKDLDLAVIERASEILVVFSGVFLQFVLTGKAKGAVVASIDWTLVYAIVGMLGSNVALQVRRPRKGRIAVRFGAPAGFDMVPEMLLQTPKGLECCGLLLAGMPAATIDGLIIGELERVFKMGVVVVGNINLRVKAQRLARRPVTPPVH
jgi:hypothetical protein